MSQHQITASVIKSYYKKYATHVERVLALRRMAAMAKITPCNRMALITCLFDWNAVYLRANKHMGFKAVVPSYTRLKQLNVPDKIVEPIKLYPHKLRNDTLNQYVWTGATRSPFLHLANNVYLPEVMLLHDCLRVVKEQDEAVLDEARFDNNINALLKDTLS